jgi:hypothetical protein
MAHGENILKALGRSGNNPPKDVVRSAQALDTMDASRDNKRRNG